MSASGQSLPTSGQSGMAMAASHGATISFGRFLTLTGISFVVAFGLIWGFVATFPMAFMDRDYPLWQAKRAMLDACTSEGAVAVFGDSRTVAGIMPQAMSELAPLRTVNFALSGTSPLETYFNVRRALACPVAPRLVVIAHGAMKFSSDSDYWRFTARDGFLSYAELRDVDRTARRLHDHGLAEMRKGDSLAPWLRDLLFAVRFPTLYFNSVVHGFVIGRWRHNLAAQDDALRTSGHALFGTEPGFSGLAGEAFPAGFGVPPLVDFYFSRTLQVLAERHVPIVVLSMPINHATAQRMTPALRGQFADYLQARTRGLDHVVVSQPVIPCWPDAFYGDAWHMNGRGAQAFSREFATWLQPVLAGAPPGPMPDHCNAG